LSDCPEIDVEFIDSDADPFDPGELGAVCAPPAIANALASRQRTAAQPAAERSRDVMLPAGHPPVAAPRLGVLLVNLGTPDAPTTGAVRRYLKEFLSDPRVVEIPPLVWQPILQRDHPQHPAQQKSPMPMPRSGPDGSPLAAITKSQAEALQARLGDARAGPLGHALWQPGARATRSRR
jgi:hypothetical protein